MPKPTKGARLGGSPAHQKLMLANLATSLFTHGRITTTEAKAKRLRPFAERLVTHAKHGDLHHRREVMKIIRDKNVVHTLFAEIGPFFAEREGGYTRIVKTLPRKGDNAPMAMIELLQETTVTSEADRARRVRGSRTEAAAAGGGSTAVAAPLGGDAAQDEVPAESGASTAANVGVESDEGPAASAAATELDDERADEAAFEQQVMTDDDTAAGPSQQPVVEDAAVSATDADVAADEQETKDSPS